MARGKASGQSAQTQLRVGRLTKAHGLKGALKLELFTDDPAKRFAPGAEFSLQVPTSSPWHGKRISLTELRWYNGHPVGFFEGVADRTAAESLVKAILWVEQPVDEPGEEDAWYDHQLVGLTVVRDGSPVGTIARLEHLPAQDLLVVKTADGEVLVPFVKAIVPSVDIEARVVTVTPPAGLFEELVDEDPEPEASEPAETADPKGEADDAAGDAESDGPEPGTSADSAAAAPDDASPDSSPRD
ncbi:ribosome maturation factor RimM [Naasia lichenicola]|uniref:Ribosome maturation factor RimM n=1 Tax=Naasia lichenicola TaxID=2565933 RepID=A0A4S4FN96_9MICO|nr:ribosome maturation factor RimM [Naasia lichenicola]THG31738.1 ribosome maturation factor RimM [Naasia lichenicola]